MPQAPRGPGIVLLTIFLIILSAADAHSQHVAGAHRKTDSLPLVRPAAPLSEDQIEAKLVELALQGPQYEGSGHQVKMSQYQLSKAKKSWMNLLAVSLNYNDQSFAKSTAANGTYVYPKYFFGLTIPLGVIFSLGPDIKGAREGVKYSESNREELGRVIKADVLSKYKTYKNYRELILLQNTIVVDQQSAFSQVEKKFKDGTVTIDVYNQANKNYSEELTKKLNLQLAQDLVRLSIEKLIGVDLESVIK